jgi:hypothetical protein
MHLENRVGGKILTTLLSIGANLYQQRRAASNIDDFIAQVESIASTVILCTEWRPKQWRVPTKENNQEIASVSLSNSKTGTFMTLLEPLINCIFQHPDDTRLHEDETRRVRSLPSWRLWVRTPYTRLARRVREQQPAAGKWTPAMEELNQAGENEPQQKMVKNCF